MMVIQAELNGDDPLILFQTWLAKAEATELNDATAAALATATPDGIPSVRMVLVKKIEDRGFSFYTNAESQKGTELRENPRAALCFHWKSLRRQVRVEGSITELPDNVADAYFHSRSRGSQIGAAVSAQSRPLEDRSVLEGEVAAFTESHGGEAIARPSFWRGYLLGVARIEFWIDGTDRLHDRLLFTRGEDRWTRVQLYP